MKRRALVAPRRLRCRGQVSARVILFVALGGLVLAEAVAAVLPGIPHSAVTVADAQMGFRKLPNQHFVGPRGIPVDINSKGYRDREWSESEDAYRVALLGQSMAYGARVEIEKGFGRRLETHLQSRLDAAEDSRRARVMNFALPGYRLEQMVRAYEHDAKAYRPELVIVATTAHDIQVMPESIAAEPGPVSCWIKRRALTRVIAHHARSYLRPPVLRRVDPPAGHPAQQPRPETEGLSTVRKPFAPEAQPKWELAQDALERLRQQVVEHGGELVVLCLPMLSHVHDANLPHHAPIWQSWAEGKSGVRVVDSAEPIRSSMSELLLEMAEKGRTFEQTWKKSKLGQGPAEALELDHAEQSAYLFFDPFHFSAKGHAVLAQWLDGQLPTP